MAIEELQDVLDELANKAIRIRELEEVLALSEKRRAVIEAEWGYVIAKKDKAEARVSELESALRKYNE